MKNNDRAIEELKRCLAISPGYNAAGVFYAQLAAASRQRKQ